MYLNRPARTAALLFVLAPACACGPVIVSRPTPAPPAVVITPGVSQGLAQVRAATLRDVRYDLILDLTGADRARGRISIDVIRSATAGELVLDFRGPALDSVQVNGVAVPVQRAAPHVNRGTAHVGSDAAPTNRATVHASAADPHGGVPGDPAAVWRDGHIIIPASLLQAGENHIEALFAAAIAAAGASIIRFEDNSDGSVYLYTLLVPADASQLLPSFDQPDLKARVTFHAIVPATWRVLANGPQRARTALDDGRVRYDFDQTRPISTYLVAFAAGPWTTLAADDDDAVPTSLWVRASRADAVDGDTLLATNAWARAWLAQYFDSPFPFAKMDLLLAPAFPFGGMEHVGAIFYNENSFIFREPPTLVQRLARDATIYHEVAHQWFGDLVTMRWFDDLWLKEGFATYMAARIQAERNPESGAWKSFYLRNKPRAYGVDETSGTTPVWQALPNLDLAKSNYGPIVYNKAPSVLKQLAFLVGEEAFRASVQTFLDAYAYDNATWRDLLSALGATAGMDLTPFGEQYMLRAGMPEIETTLTLDSVGVMAGKTSARNGAGDAARATSPRRITGDAAGATSPDASAGATIASLVLTQRPARALPDDPGGTWPMRLRVRLGYANRPDTTLTVLLQGARTELTEARGLPAPQYVFPNDGDFGYARFLLDDRSAKYLLDNVDGLDNDLLRAMVWGALWDLMRAGRLAPDAFAARAIAALPLEADEQIAAQLTGRIASAIDRYMPPGPARQRLVDIHEDLLLERMSDPALSYGMRRGALDAFFSFGRTDRARTVLRAYLAERRHFDGEPLRQPSRWSALTRLLALDDPAARSLLDTEIARDTTPDAERQAFIAAAAIPTIANKSAYFDRYLHDADLNEEWVTASLDAFNDPLHASLVLRYLEPALRQSVWLRDNRRIFFLPAWLDSFIGTHATQPALAIVDGYLAGNPQLPADVRRRILLPRDQLERVVRVKRYTGP